MEKTKVEMEMREGTLRNLLKQAQLSLRLSAELDSIQNHGLKGWNEYLIKNARRRKSNRRAY